MKRWIAGLLGLMMLLGMAAGAAAEEPQVAEVSWDTYESLMEAMEIEASYVLLGETNIVVWMPDSLLIGYMDTDEEEAEDDGEEPAEETENGDAEDDGDEEEEDIIAQFGPGDESALIEVTLWEAEEGMETVEDLIPVLTEDGENVLRVKINGLDGVYLEDPEDAIAFLLVMFEPGKILKFTFYPIDDEGFSATCEIIIASIQQAEVEED